MQLGKESEIGTSEGKKDKDNESQSRSKKQTECKKVQTWRKVDISGYLQQRLFRHLECDVHCLSVGITREHFIAVLYVAELGEQRLDVLEADMERQTADYNLRRAAAVTSYYFTTRAFT